MKKSSIPVISPSKANHDYWIPSLYTLFTTSAAGSLHYIYIDTHVINGFAIVNTILKCFK